VIVLLGLVLIGGGAVGAAAELPIYQVRVAENLARLSISVCRSVDMPHRFALEDTKHARALRNVTYGAQRLGARRGRVKVPAAEPGCLSYDFEISRVREERRASVLRMGSDLLASPAAWLLAPVDEVPFEVHFALPSGVQVSAPWQPLDDALRRYRVEPSPTGWQPIVAFGRFEQFPIELPGGRLDVAVLDGQPRADVAQVRDWVEAAARHVTLAYGSFPVPRAQVVIVPVVGLDAWGGRGTEDAVPFARVLRRGGIAAQFFVNQIAPLDSYLSDWTATHEFSHMLLPYISQSDAWLSEGFASYYQNVLRARAGVLTEEVAWRKLHEGFSRGRRDDYRDTLAESVHYRGPNMIMRMYWSGAAIALLADVELRERSGGVQSLDTVLQQLQACCLPSSRTWSALEVFDQLDELAGGHVFDDLYRRWIDAVEFPDVDPVFARLGVDPVGSSVRLLEAPATTLRREIMAVRASPSAASEQ
jgi:hypothetical protein